MISTAYRADTCQLCGHQPLEPFVVPGKTKLWLCRQCGLYQNGPLADATVYDDETYHDGYEEQRERKDRTAAVRLARIASLVTNESARFLDIGCGVGITVEAARKRGWQAVGVDVSSRVVDVCRSRGLESHVVEGERLPFADESFDVITAWSVIEHVADVRQTLAEWRRVLRVGGVLALDTSDASCWKAKLLGARYQRFWVDGHTYAFSRSTLSKLLEESGLEPIRAPWLHCWQQDSLSMSCYALGYQAQYELRQKLRIQKAMQFIARRSEDG